MCACMYTGYIVDMYTGYILGMNTGYNVDMYIEYKMDCVYWIFFCLISLHGKRFKKSISINSIESLT